MVLSNFPLSAARCLFPILMFASVLSGCSYIKNKSDAVFLTINNSFNQLPVKRLSSTPQTLYRVELPYSYHLQAENVSAARVDFWVDGKRVNVDARAPFQLATKSPDGKFTLTLKAYNDLNNDSSLQFEKSWQIDISRAGMSSAQEMPDEQHQQWLKQNLDSVLKKETFQASNGMTMPYRLFVPEHYQAGIQYPLVVFLHGRGQRGSQNEADMFEGVGLFNGAQSIVSPRGQAQFPSIVLIPQCSDKSPDEEWASWEGNSPEQPFEGLGDLGGYTPSAEPSESGAAALELIERIVNDYSVDRQRIYLTGVSMGGFGAWEFTGRRPGLFAAAVPMAGYSSESYAEKIKDIPFWVFHGSQDEYNPVEGSRKMVALLKSLDANIRYTELDGAKHNESFVEAWQNQQILPWMFSQIQQ